MRWFHTRLLWASVSLVGAASTAAAQPSGSFVTLTRPNPLPTPRIAASGSPAASAPVGLARPVPLALPAATPIQQASYTGAAPVDTPAAASMAAPATPGYTVRAQMDGIGARLLPALSELPGSNLQTVTQTVPGPASPAAGGTPPAGAAPANPPGDGSKTFVPPQPRTFVMPNNAGLTERIETSNGPVVVYQDFAPNVFGGIAPASRFYARAEYLNWWVSGYHLPVLVTTGPATTPEDLRGVLGQPGTVPLFGGGNTGNAALPGARFFVGMNLDPCGLCGIEAGGFFLGRHSNNFTADSAQFPVLARPFFNVNTGAPDRELTASPGTLPADFFMLRGSVTVNNFTDLWGTQINARRLLCGDCNYSLAGFAGFRYLNLHDGLSITENAVSAQAVPGFPIFNPGNQIVVMDSFDTRNQFYGGQLGLDGEIRRGPWFVGGRAAIGLGVTNQHVTIAGSQTVTTLAGQVSQFNGGLLALPSNIGSFSQNRFTVVPEVGLRVGYNLTPNIRVFVGYNFLYWSSVVRPGGVIDPRLNVAQIPNFNSVPPNPAFTPPSNIVAPVVPFRTTGFFAEGVSAGVEVRY